MRLDDPSRQRPSWPRRGAGERVAVLAHRGGEGPWRENTLRAFLAALDAGADGVELDVRLSADAVAVVHHDAAVEGAGPLAAMAAGELPSWVPTLAQALEACAGALVNVELKLEPAEASERSGPATDALARAVVPVLAGADCAAVVSSFWPDALEAVSTLEDAAGLGASTPLALLVHPALDAQDALVRARALGWAAIHPHVSQITGELVGRAHGLGLGVTTWTVNDPAEVERALACGVDGLITDTVAAAVAACRLG